MNERIYILLTVVGLVMYFGVIMPMRNYLCETHNMTAVWYIQGCVNKELNK